MNLESNDRNHEHTTDEFEKLEFLPEQPAEQRRDPDDTAEIVFAPELTDAEDTETQEPPVSFSPAGKDGDALSFDPTPLPDPGDSVPFELLGSSLFDDAEFDEDLDPLGPDELDDDLEF